MNVQTLSLPRFLTRAKHHKAPQQERVEGVYMQEQSFGIALSDPSIKLVKELNQLPAGTILVEYTRMACKNSAAGTTLFIP